MKKIVLSLVLFMLFLLPIQAFAASYGNLYYVSYLDQYRLDYSYNTADTHFDLVFTAADGTIYTSNYNFPPTGIHYLTCNGTYNMRFYDSSGAIVHTAGPMVTTAIVNPTCNSYAQGVAGNNDLNARQSGNQILWDANPSATNYEIWKDGAKISDTTGTSFSPTADGGYSIVAKDANGNIVGTSDLNYKAPFDPNCPECQQLRNMLQCPEWSTYMGDLTQAFKNALPPPPDWDQIADKIGAATINHLQTYFGPVPDAPTQTEIDNQTDAPLPTVDATSPDADSLVPSVPAGYEQAKPFDITTGPQIDVQDESVPFQIFDPLHNIVHDDPGVPVIPGDPRNNTGGIQTPAVTSYPIATPQPTPTALPDNPVPIPSSSPGSAPAPTTNTTSGSGPIPLYKGD